MVAPLSFYALCRERQTHSPARVPLEGAMHGAGVANEVRAGPRVPTEEFVRQHVSLEPITRRAGGDQVARRVRASLRHGVHVIERRDVERQRNGAVDAASAAITHGSVLECTLEAVIVDGPRAT